VLTRFLDGNKYVRGISEIQMQRTLGLYPISRRLPLKRKPIYLRT
jgi:hypothetical protein